MCKVSQLIKFLLSRSMVEPLFTQEQIDAMRPQIQKTVDSRLDIMIKEGCKTPVDVVEKLALPVASYVSTSG